MYKRGQNMSGICVGFDSLLLTSLSSSPLLCFLYFQKRSTKTRPFCFIAHISRKESSFSMEVARMGENVERHECNEYSSSSGCESGWTNYFDQSEEEQRSLVNHNKGWGLEQEEDLSMVSDASSGPPHLPDDDPLFHCNHQWDYTTCLCSPFSQFHEQVLVTKGGKRRRVDSEKQQQHYQEKQRQESCGLLDDTASSTLISFAKNNVDVVAAENQHVDDVLDMSYGFSATRFKRKSTLPRQLGHFNQNSTKPILRGREGRNKMLMFSDAQCFLG